MTGCNWLLQITSAREARCHVSGSWQPGPRLTAPLEQNQSTSRPIASNVSKTAIKAIRLSRRENELHTPSLLNIAKRNTWSKKSGFLQIDTLRAAKHGGHTPNRERERGHASAGLHRQSMRFKDRDSGRCLALWKIAQQHAHAPRARAWREETT